MKRLMGLFLSAALLTGLFAGCAGTPANETNTSRPPVSNTSTPEPSQNKESAWPRTIKDAAGYEVVLEAKPERVTMLHTYPLEFLLALGIKPTATARANLLGEVADLSQSELYSPYVDGLDMMDLGSALEINLEAVLESNPDVIITFAGHRGVDAIHDQLVAAAPVIYIDYTATWQDQLAFCAQIFGKEDEVDGIVADIEGEIADANKTLEKHSERTLAFFRTDGKGFIALGGAAYYNTFKITKPDGFSAETISLEAVADMDPYYIVFQHNYKSSVAFVESMKSSSVWNSLDAVKDGRVYYFDEEMNTFGPLTMRLAAEKLTQLYTE